MARLAVSRAPLNFATLLFAPFIGSSFFSIFLLHGSNSSELAPPPPPLNAIIAALCFRTRSLFCFSPWFTFFCSLRPGLPPSPFPLNVFHSLAFRETLWPLYFCNKPFSPSLSFDHRLFSFFCEFAPFPFPPPPNSFVHLVIAPLSTSFRVLNFIAARSFFSLTPQPSRCFGCFFNALKDSETGR